MKKIVFDKIRLQNFLSFGNDPTELVFENGITFITGTNLDKNSKNGVGKTALVIESISYALFGETNRKILISNIRNWKSSDECIVQLWFTVNNDKYEIIRSANPSKLFLYKNSHLHPEKEDANISRTIPETTKDIIDILGISKEIFTNTLVMTNKSTAFLEQGTPLKTKFIEGILSLEVFSKMLERSKMLFKEKDKEVVLQQGKIEELSKSITQDEKYHDDDESKRKSDIEYEENKLLELNKTEQIDNSLAIDNEKNILEKINSSITDTSEKLQKIQIKQAEIQSNLKNKQNELNNFNKLICPTCKRPLDDHRPDEIEKEKTNISKDIDEINKTLDKYETGVKKLAKDISNKKTEHSFLTKKIQILSLEHLEYNANQEKIESVKNRINQIKERTNPFTDKIKQNEENLVIYKEEQQKSKNELKIYETLKFVTSPTGIKSLVIKKIIKILNDRMNYYLNRLDAPVRIEFDEFFEDQITYDNGKLISYGSLSGGEAKRVDFAMLFAFRDIRRLQSNITVNISIFDELFDSAVCQIGIDKIMTLLKEIGEDEKETFIIISHKIEQIDTDGCRVIELEKKNGITRIV